MEFSQRIIDWYQQHQRDLPWRKSRDPYKIWLSEIILQQTRVAQGLDYFNKFVDHYPTVIDLANASEDEVLKDWQGLGYYSRARNLHYTAKVIANEYQGKFPDTYDDILALKGVGSYTAAAIASFAFSLPHAVVDGNVYRVLARIFGIDTPIDSTKGKKAFQQLADELIDHKQPDAFNQAIMEFGAIQCTPKKPNCSQCTFIDHCLAYSENKIDLLPVKEKKIKQRNRYFTYLHLTEGSNIYLRKRTAKDIWINLYEFPLIESEAPLEVDQILKHPSFINWLGENGFHLISASKEYKHILSHQRIFARFIAIEIEGAKNLNHPDAFPIPSDQLSKYAIPKLLENYLSETSKLLSLF